MKINLYLMSEKGYEVLRNLIDAHYTPLIGQVIQAQDKNVQNDYYTEIHDLCIQQGITVSNRRDLTEPVAAEYSIAISWRWLIPVEGASNLIVLHDSLLPRYRGFAPLVNMTINREPRIGVTALYANAEFDRGDIIMQKSVPVDYPIKIQDAIELIAPLYAGIVVDIFRHIATGQELPAARQNEDEASYSLWRDEEDYQIDWSQSAQDIQQFCYSVGYPYRGASTQVEGMTLRVMDCEVMPDVSIENRTAGKLLFVNEGCPVVVCGQGLLKLTRVIDEEGQNALPLKKFRIRFK